MMVKTFASTVESMANGIAAINARLLLGIAVIAGFACAPWVIDLVPFIPAAALVGRALEAGYRNVGFVIVYFIPVSLIVLVLALKQIAQALGWVDGFKSPVRVYEHVIDAAPAVGLIQTLYSMMMVLTGLDISESITGILGHLFHNFGVAILSSLIGITLAWICVTLRDWYEAIQGRTES